MDLAGDMGGVLEVFISLLGLFIGPISDHSFLTNIISKLYKIESKNTNLTFKEPDSKIQTT